MNNTYLHFIHSFIHWSCIRRTTPVAFHERWFPNGTRYIGNLNCTDD